MLEEVSEVDPGGAGARWLLVIANTWSGHYQTAIDMGNAFISEFGPDPELLLWIGKSYGSLGEFEPAALYYQRAHQLFGDYANMYDLLDHAILMREMGNVEAKTALLQELLEQTRLLVNSHPDNGRARIFQALATGMLGDREQVEQIEGFFLSGTLRGFSLAPLIILRMSMGDIGRANELFRFMLRQESYDLYHARQLQTWVDKDPEFRRNFEALQGLRERLLAKYGDPAS